MSYITITPHEGAVRILWRGHAIVSTTRALDLREGGAGPVLYVPREDADMAYFAKTARSTHCPHKGDAGYFSLHDGETRAENAVWTYETPLPGAAAIKDHLAFYPNQVTIEQGA
jgi:uncharacterized protein (DUF427 family)